MCHPSGSLQSWSVLGDECLAPNKSPGHQVSNEFLPKQCGAPCVLPVCGWEVKRVPSDSPARGIRNACSLCLGFPQAFLPFADIASGPLVVNHSKTQLHDRRVNLTVPTDLSPAGRCYHTITWFCFFIHFSLRGVHVCVCILHMWGVHWTYVHRRKRKPKVVSGIILSVSSTLLNEAGFLNQTQSSLMSSLANQLALGIPPLPSDAGMTGRLPHLLSIYIDFWGFELWSSCLCWLLPGL